MYTTYSKYNNEITNSSNVKDLSGRIVSSNKVMYSTRNISPFSQLTVLTHSRMRAQEMKHIYTHLEIVRNSPKAVVVVLLC